MHSIYNIEGFKQKKHKKKKVPLFSRFLHGRYNYHEFLRHKQENNAELYYLTGREVVAIGTIHKYSTVI